MILTPAPAERSHILRRMATGSDLGEAKQGAAVSRPASNAASTAKKRPRVRARVGRRQRRPFVIRRPGTTGLILFAIAALAVLAVGILAASLTVFAPPAPSNQGVGSGPTPTPASSGLVGHPIDGTLLAVSVATGTVAIQPSSGTAVEATVTAQSKITRGGAAAPLASLIPGEAVVVTFASGPGGTLVVLQLQDIISLPTNTPSPTFTPTPTPTSEPTPSPSPTASPGSPPSPPGPPG